MVNMVTSQLVPELTRPVVNSSPFWSTRHHILVNSAFHKSTRPLLFFRVPNMENKILFHGRRRQNYVNKDYIIAIYVLVYDFFKKIHWISPRK